MAYFPGVIRAGKRGKAEAIRFPTIYDFPNVIGRIPPNHRLVDFKDVEITFVVLSEKTRLRVNRTITF